MKLEIGLTATLLIKEKYIASSKYRRRKYDMWTRLVTSRIFQKSLIDLYMCMLMLRTF